MKVLTVGQSPHLLTKLGRMHSTVVKTLSKDHQVYIAATDHDTSYFMSDEDGIYRYEDTRIHPFNYKEGERSKRFLEILEKVKPDVVLSIGDYHETAFLADLKNFYWVAILAIEALPINSDYVSQLNQIDHAIFTHTSAWMSAAFSEELTHIPSSLANYSFDEEIFSYKKEDLGNVFWTICCAKNTREDNPTAYISGAARADRFEDMNKMRHYLHTNIHDKGYYDLETIVEDVNNDGIWFDLTLPYRFSSIKEGISDIEMSRLFSRSAVVVDVSSRSSTGLTVRQGMACGCIPLVTKSCAMFDILRGFDDTSPFLVESVPYMNERHEIDHIASPDSLASKLVELYKIWKWNREEYEELRKKCVNIVRRYSKTTFEKEIDEVVAKANGLTKKILPVNVFDR